MKIVIYSMYNRGLRGGLRGMSGENMYIHYLHGIFD